MIFSMPSNPSYILTSSTAIIALIAVITVIISLRIILISKLIDWHIVVEMMVGLPVHKNERKMQLKLQ